jgi:hypothetical protein
MLDAQLAHVGTAETVQHAPIAAAAIVVPGYATARGRFIVGVVRCGTLDPALADRRRLAVLCENFAAEACIAELVSHAVEPAPCSRTAAVAQTNVDGAGADESCGCCPSNEVS